MLIPSARQMSGLDKYTIDNEPITSLDLMERAATSVTHALRKRFTPDTPVVVFAGPGNNGGDALAVARMLSAADYQVECYLFNINGHLSEDCRQNRKRLLEETTVGFHEINSQFEAPVLTASHLVLDGLFGTGLNRPLNGGFASLVKFINACPAKVVSIDVPSGLMCENNAENVRGHIIRACLTLTFQLPKLALLLPDMQTFVGELEILPIGLHPDGINLLDTPYSITEEKQVRTMLKPRDPFAHKGTFGNALLVAGKYGMAGAAILAAKACLRAGVGKVTVHTPERNNDILQVAVPEAVMSQGAGKDILTYATSSEAYDAIAIGPGIGTE